MLLLTRPVAWYANAVERPLSYSATGLKLVELLNGIAAKGHHGTQEYFRSFDSCKQCTGIPLHIGLHDLHQCSEASSCQVAQASFACLATLVDQRIGEECCVFDSLPSFHAWHGGSVYPDAALFQMSLNRWHSAYLCE